MFSGSSKILPQLSVAAGLAAMLLSAGSVSAVVVYSDDFEDADLDNLGYAVDDVDTNRDGAIGTWTSTNTSFPDPITEVTGPAPGSTPGSGLRWHNSQGFTSSGAPKSSPSIVNDDAVTGLPDSININTGYALGLEGKGRSTSTVGFFDGTPTPGQVNDQRLTLGLKVNSEVKVNFDWRVWESNPATPHVPLLPTRAQLRFGLYQDTDNQLGSVNSFAGPGFTPATWGQEGGAFRGDWLPQAGANGDAGWFTKLFVGDEDYTINPNDNEPEHTGDDNRIVEETNLGTTSSARFLEGSDQDSVASPPDGTIGDPSSFFPLLKVGTLYNIEFSLVRTVEAAFQGDPNGLITATVTVNELDANHAVIASHSFGDEESAGDPLNPVPGEDGVQSDVWDYIAFRNSSGDPEQDYDFIIDNLVIEEIPACILGDLDCNGVVGLSDLALVLNNWDAQEPPPFNEAQDAADADDDGIVALPDLALVLNNWNNTASSTGAAVPEPTSLALLGLAGLATLSRRK